MDKCTISRFLQTSDECHKLTYCRKAALKTLGNISEADKNLLADRINTQQHELRAEDTICLHHEKKYLDKYEHLQRSCCDPLQLHTEKPKTKGLSLIDDHLLHTIKHHNPKKTVCKGQKLCPTCRIAVAQPAESTEESDEPEEFIPPEVDKATVDDVCHSLGISPMKPQGSTLYGKRKVSQIQSSAAKKIAEKMDISVDEILEDKTKPCDKCSDLVELSENIKKQIENAKTVQEKISLTMLAPESWTKAQIKDTFGVSERIIKYAREYLKQQKISAEPRQKKGKTLEEDTVQKVKALYEDDEVSRICPGIQDYVSVKINGTRVQKQKRLLLANLKEVYAMFKHRYPDSKIGFSTFCALRPGWVVTTSASGMHNVCVCQIHQNLKLMVDALPRPLNKMDYTELFDLIVCNKDDRACMIHRCEKCPGQEAVRKFIAEKLESYGMDDDDIIQYKQWTHTDRTELITVSQEVRSYVDVLVQKVDTVSTHHFIAKQQAAYLKRMKQQLKENEMIVLLDFAQNYSFIVQDAIQGHHWNNSMATVHPYALYYLNNGKLENQSSCIISDCLDHNVYTVYRFNKELIEYIKRQHPAVNRILYWSDGAASQYKNFKNMCNLGHHLSDYNIDAEWHFFATSHGKSPCDGIGGTVKRLAAAYSLKATSSDHILTPQDLFRWASDNISGIHFVFVSKDSVEESKPDQDARFEHAKTIPGTRSHHVFVPTVDGNLKLGRISQDIETDMCTMVSNIGSSVNQLQPVVPSPGQYVAAVYDRKWYVGNAVEISTENRDVRIDFMVKSGPVSKPSFRWPAKGKRDDKCWVPFENVLIIINVPTVASSSGRLYHIDADDLTKIKNLFSQYKKDHY